MESAVPPTARRTSKIEVDESSLDNLHPDGDYALNRARTTGAVSISAELFEKLYLSPKNAVSGNLRKTFGNPTPIGLIGFLISLSPLSCSLMGWRGASNTGFVGIPTYFFFGGLLMILGGILEWVLGNSFPSLVFLTYGAFWLTFGGTLHPSFAAFSYFAATGEALVTGLQSREFNASFGFLLLFMALVSLCFLLCAIRINICFCFIFFTLTLGFLVLTGAYWLLAEDYAANAPSAERLIVAGGAFVFVTCMFGWWNFLAIILESVDFPISLPVGDLSTLVKGRSQRSVSRA
ncbi:GPR1/FUN34/YaaH-class plasma membrane protein [Coniella lustricola]|uniref:GPR1/FUN34/YaaH-class plasma membrane protein n=1 Tax=Coniella lustricola TaxID=2025994 RepID=A0A2T3AH51_9PEZI|nr:GPR1/FUN34/YaaH-class plasma membrane protein [Coniella lustricola]